jgi:hypothetical protein
MGTVWLARQLSLDTPCALKFLHGDAASSPDLRARFEREAKAAALLRSPNVVQIFDHGVWENVPFIVMELLEGEDLRSRLRRVRMLDARTTVRIVTHVARALAKAHAAGLVHRDLKPANIFLVRDEDREVAKVLDFGVAKRISMDVGDGHTKTGAILGTPFYMSPEQARGVREVDHRTDLWALGVIAFQCLTGKRPFQSTAMGQLFGEIMYEPLPVPSQVGPVPPGFDAWWARAAQRDPALRFQSAREMAEALTVALDVSTTMAEGDATPSMAVPAPDAVPPEEAVAGQVLATPVATVPLADVVSPQTTSAVATHVLPAPARRGGQGVLFLAGGLLAAAALAGVAALFVRGTRSAPESTAAAASTVAVPIESAVGVATASATPSASAAEPRASASAPEPPPAVSPRALPVSPRSPATPTPKLAPPKAKPPAKGDPFARPD